MLVLVQAVSCAGDEGEGCQFPFVFNNVTLHSCTWYRSYGTGGYPWCATEAGVYRPRKSRSNLALCKPDSGQPISSLECRPSSGSCASDGVLSVCGETYGGQALHSWCVSVSNITGSNMAVHNSCPQQCLQDGGDSFSLGFVCSSSETECSVFFLLSLLLVVVVLCLSIVVCLLLRKKKTRRRLSINPGDNVRDSIIFMR